MLGSAWTVRTNLPIKASMIVLRPREDKPARNNSDRGIEMRRQARARDEANHAEKSIVTE